MVHIEQQHNFCISSNQDLRFDSFGTFVCDFAIFCVRNSAATALSVSNANCQFETYGLLISMLSLLQLDC